MSRRVLVQASKDRHGWVHAYPMSEELTFDAVMHRCAVGQPICPGESLIFCQSEQDVADFEALIPKRKRRDMDEGYSVTFLMDREQFNAYVGWDFGSAPKGRES